MKRKAAPVIARFTEDTIPTVMLGRPDGDFCIDPYGDSFAYWCFVSAEAARKFLARMDLPEAEFPVRELSLTDWLRLLRKAANNDRKWIVTPAWYKEDNFNKGYITISDVLATFDGDGLQQFELN